MRVVDPRADPLQENLNRSAQQDHVFETVIDRRRCLNVALELLALQHERRTRMSERERFTESEWDALVKASSGAFVVVVAADSPRLIPVIKEMRAGSKAMRAARKEQGWPSVVSELIAYQAEHEDELRKSTASGDTAEDAARISRELVAAAGAPAAKLTPEELEGYVRWVVGTARAVAEAAKEGRSTSPISDSEAAALAEIEALLRSGQHP